MEILLILVVLLFIIYICFKDTSSLEKFENGVDVVYTWVDYDKQLEEEMKQHGGRLMPMMYKDMEELKYSLRSVEQYMSWCRRIFIVVKDGQKPQWLNETNSRIKIITHSQIIPKKYLPTFNSIVIESYLHCIPGLSEKYIYFNDDILLWNPVTEDMFFTKTNRTIESASSKLNPPSFPNLKCYDGRIEPPKFPEVFDFMTMMEWNGKLIEQYLGTKYDTIRIVHHAPFPNLKSVNQDLDDFLSTLVVNNWSLHEDTSRSKFRHNQNIARMSVFRKYFYLWKNRAVVVEGEFGCKMIECSHLRRNTVEIEGLEHDRDTKFINIQNNIEYDDPGALVHGVEDWKQIQNLLKKKFSKPSAFEVDYF